MLRPKKSTESTAGPVSYTHLDVYKRQEEELKNGDKRLVDEAFIRQAIVNPNSVVLPKYPAIMPTFQGQINEEQVLQLVAYVKSLASEERKTDGK